jgi:hypothetical protein
MASTSDGAATCEVSESLALPATASVPPNCLGVAVASAVFAAAELGWVPVGQQHAASLVVLVLTVPLQVFSAGLAFATRDPAYGSGAGLLAGSWAAIAIITLTSPPGSRSPELGVALLVVSTGLVAPVVAGAAQPLAALVTAGSAVRFVLTAMTQLLHQPGWRDLAGAGGLVLAVLALGTAWTYDVRAQRNSARPPGSRAESRPGRR